jgi:glycosyltransferase involved in cell wall biosynthesis
MSSQVPRDIILFSTADWTSKYWTNKQHIASRLAARGHRVLYVETVGLRMPGLNAPDAKRMLSRLQRGLASATQVRENLWTLSPLTIPLGHGNRVIAAINSWQLRARIKSWMGANAIQAPLVWTYHPYMLDAIDTIQRSKLIYHCADDLGAMPGIDRGPFDAAERRLLEVADVTFTTSPYLQQRCSAVAGTRSHYFCNVADIDHFGTARLEGQVPPDLQRIGRPRLAYVGVLSDFKTDFDILDAIATARPNWNLVLVGEPRAGQIDAALDRLAARPNVHLLGWRSYEELPRYLSGVDVALLPQRINDYTRAMFPMKFFEYLAAGLPVVSTPIGALDEFKALYASAPDAASFIAAVESILARPRVALPLDAPVLRENSWDRRLDRMLAVIDTASTNGTGGTPRAAQASPPRDPANA